MKKILLLAVITIFNAALKANDLVVEENGLAPSYNSIASALAAANNGDRIFIKNKAGNIPWLENDTIKKSVDLLAFQSDTFFIVQGNFVVAPAANVTINIIGMLNKQGSITTNATPTGSRSTLRVLGCQFEYGSINVSNNNYYLMAEGCNLEYGGIEFHIGQAVGNIIYSDGISVGAESISPADTCYIFGNQINSTAINGNGIYIYDITSAVDIRNNYIQAAGVGIYFYAHNTTAVNKIYNNTVSMYGTQPSITAITLSPVANQQVDVQNNVIQFSGSGTPSRAFVSGGSSSGIVSVTYNFIDNAFTTPYLGTIAVNMNNQYTSISLNANGSTTNSVGVNGGNPGPQFYDTDLTVNDAGCYGGSFTLNNFFPLFPAAPSTWLTNYQFNVRTGNTLKINANSFSR